MYKYYKVDDNGVVISTQESSSPVLDDALILTDELPELGSTP